MIRTLRRLGLTNLSPAEVEKYYEKGGRRLPIAIEAVDPDETIPMEERPASLPPHSAKPTFSPTVGATWLGRYVLLTQIGRGGMGLVWRARDRTLEMDVAIKFLPPEVSRERRAVEALRRETRLCIGISHRNVVRVYDFKDDGTRAALVMEFITGQSLAERLRLASRGYLNPDELAPLIAQLCSALDCVHFEAGMVHSDVKPENLVVDGEGQLKLLDFGVARLAETHRRFGQSRDFGGGTPGYMSPQQAAGCAAEKADDIYALGATLYKLLTGSLPKRENELAGTRADEELNIDAARAARGATERIPPAWRQTISACLSDDPRKRPASAGDVARRLGLGSALTAANSERWVATLLLLLIVGIALPYGLALKDGGLTGPRPKPELSFRLGKMRLESLALDLIAVPPGEFVMGSPKEEPGHTEAELPLLEVKITKGFWLGSTPVTQRQYEAVMRHNPSRFRDVGPDAPVENVSWHDAEQFCVKLTEMERAAKRIPEGYVFQLPSEAEWEYACRAMSPGPFAGDLDAMAWYAENSGSSTHPVARKQPNHWGFYDMHGNVWQWCRDIYRRQVPGAFAGGTADEMSGANRSVRGGTWTSPAHHCRSAARLGLPPASRFDYLGFRVALVRER